MPPTAIELTAPFTFGRQLVTRYGRLALKLKTLFLMKVVRPLPWRLGLRISVKLPTAYMVEPHCTIWRIWNVLLVLTGKAGVRVRGEQVTAPDGRAQVAAAAPVAALAEVGAMIAPSRLTVTSGVMIAVVSTGSLRINRTGAPLIQFAGCSPDSWAVSQFREIRPRIDGARAN